MSWSWLLPPLRPCRRLPTRYFNVTSGYFALRYVLGGGDPRAPTEIFAWPERYPRGVAISAVAEDKGRDVSMRVEQSGSRVLIYPAAGVAAGARVSVTVRAK